MTQLKVELYRYDLTNGMATQFSPVLIGRPLEGIWHTAIVVAGTEYYFDGGVGIVKGSAGRTRFGLPKRSEVLGFTSKTIVEFEQWNTQQMLSTRFGPNSYNLMNNNCNHYSQEASQFLLSANIPEDVRSMIPTLLATPLGQMIGPMLHQMTSAPGAGMGGISATPFGDGIGAGVGGGLGGFNMGDNLANNLAGIASGLGAMGMGTNMSGAAGATAAPTATAAAAVPFHEPLDADTQESLDIYIALISSDDAAPDAKKTTLDALERILSNIRNHPTNPHYQRLSLSSEFYKSKIASPFEVAQELLLLAGFVVDDETHLTFKGDASHLGEFVNAIQKAKADV